MRTFDVQTVPLDCSASEAFRFIAEPHNLPRWAHAFAEVRSGKARLRTPAGEAEITLEVIASEFDGTVDWKMSFPDGTTGRAYSRVVPTGSRTCAYSFVLLAPPVPLEQLEGALEQQSQVLRGELRTLQTLLSAGRSTQASAASIPGAGAGR
jgi:hypothetical protein